jgi:hypothetical protein
MPLSIAYSDSSRLASVHLAMASSLIARCSPSSMLARSSWRASILGIDYYLLDRIGVLSPFCPNTYCGLMPACCASFPNRSIQMA